MVNIGHLPTAAANMLHLFIGGAFSTVQVNSPGKWLLNRMFFFLENSEILDEQFLFNSDKQNNQIYCPRDGVEI